MSTFKTILCVDTDPLVYSFLPHVTHVTLIDAVGFELEGDRQRLRRAVWRLGVPEVYLANLDVNGLGDECIEISQLDQRSFEVAWESLDYVVGNPAYAWAAVVSSEGPAVVGSTRSAAIEAVVQEWGDVQSNVIRLLQTWEGIGRKPSTEWIWPMVVHLLGPDRARDVVARYGAWLLPLES